MASRLTLRAVTGTVGDLGSVDVLMYLFYLALLALAAVTAVRDAIWFVPLVLSLVCAVLWFIARWQLGAAFSVQPEARHLVTSGLYAKSATPSTSSAPAPSCSSCSPCRDGPVWPSGPFSSPSRCCVPDVKSAS